MVQKDKKALVWFLSKKFRTIFIIILFKYIVTKTFNDRVTHKGWDCKDDLKFLKFGDPNLSILSQVYKGLSNDLEGKK